MYTTARDVMVRHEPAPRVGRISDIWMPPKFEPGSEHYDEKDPDRLQYDRRGRERNEELLVEIRRETEAWEATGRNTALILNHRREARRWDLALLQNRRSMLRDLAKLVKEQGLDGVTADMVERLKATTTFAKRKAMDFDTDCTDIRPVDESDQDAVSLIKEDLFEFLDELVEMNVAELTRLHGEINRKCIRCTEGIRRLDQELDDRTRWDNAESGVETRDVLENGVRRVDMERMMGREVTKVDVDASLKIPDADRMRIVGGHDVEQSRLNGRQEYKGQLPSSCYVPRPRVKEDLPEGAEQYERKLARGMAPK